MYLFSDFNIATEIKGFTGDQIKIDRVINRQIIVHDYRIEPSKFGGDRLDMQIEVDGVKRLVWTSGKVLMDTIKKIPKDKFPFKTTIVKENDRYEFT